MSTTVASLLRQATSALAAAGVDSARLDARLLLEHVLGVDRARPLVAPDRAVADGDRDRFQALVERRRGRQPLAQILGRREFWSLDFAVTADTLIPRPDSETLIEAALAWLAGSDVAAPRVLDLGTGSGCLLLALLHECPAARGLGLDVGAAAVSVAAANARSLGLDRRAAFLCADWNDPWTDRADPAPPYQVILANPPYIADAEIDTLQPEVAAHEPRRALAGGADGLDGYRQLLPRLAAWLTPDGAAFVEVGAGQDEAVGALAAAANLAVDRVARDLAGIGRCVVVRRACG